MAQRWPPHHGVVLQIGRSPAAEARLFSPQGINSSKDLLGQGSSIEGGATVSGQSLQGAGEGGVAEQLVGWRGVTAGEIQRLKRSAVTDPDALGDGDGATQARAGTEPITGEADGRLQVVGPGQAAVLLMGVPEQSHGAGHTDGLEATGGLPPGQRLTGGTQKIVRTAAQRGDLTAIEHLQRPLLGIPVQQEPTTGEAGTLRFHHGQHRLGTHQRIHCRTASVECSHGGLAGEGIGGDDHRLACGCGDDNPAGIGGFRIVAAHRCSADVAAADAEAEDQQQGRQHRSRE